MDRIELATVRAERAQQVLDNEMFQKAFDDTRAALLEALARQDTLDARHSVELHLMVKLVDKVKKMLVTHVETGKLAQHELEQRKRFALFRGGR